MRIFNSLFKRYSALFSEREYIKILIANIVNRLGDSIDLIIFEWLAYLLTGNPAWVASIIAFNFIPTVFLSPFAGALVESFNLKTVMVVSDAIRVLTVLCQIVLFVSGILQPYMLIVATLIISSVEAFRIPASQSVRARLLPKEKFGVAIAANQTLGNVSQLIGLGVGGVLAAISPAVALTADGALFALSAFIIFSVRGDFKAGNKERLTVKSYGESLRGGFNYIFTKKDLLFLACFGAGMNFLAQPLNVYMPSYVGDILKIDVLGLSVFMICCMLGQTVGSLIAPALRGVLGFRRTSFITGVVCALSMCALAFFPRFNAPPMANIIFIGALAFVICFPIGILQVIYASMFFENIDDKYIARVSGAFSAVSSASIPIASFVCAGLAVIAPITSIYLVFAPLQAAFFAAAFIPKSIRKLDRPAAEVQ